MGENTKPPRNVRGTHDTERHRGDAEAHVKKQPRARPPHENRVSKKVKSVVIRGVKSRKTRFFGFRGGRQKLAVRLYVIYPVFLSV